MIPPRHVPAGQKPIGVPAGPGRSLGLSAVPRPHRAHTPACADCGRAPRDGVRLTELRLLTDPAGTPLKWLCADGPDADECVATMRARAARPLSYPRQTLYLVRPPG